MLLRRYRVKHRLARASQAPKMSAKIYLFPLRGHVSPANGRVFANERSVDSQVVNLRPQTAGEVLSASAWYHPEALKAEHKRDDD